MLLLMVERGMPIDMVLAADTGKEFPEMYRHWDQVEQYLLRKRGLKLTILRHPEGFERMMFDRPVNRAEEWQHVTPYGYGWPGIKKGRWCTGQLKTHLINKAVSQLRKTHKIFHYVGIAADEPERIKGEHYPLYDWGITEAQALQICYDRGFDWGGLYEIYHRCSCWCCPFQRIDELRKLRRYHPQLWTKLLDMDDRALAQFGHNALGRFKDHWTVAELDGTTCHIDTTWGDDRSGTIDYQYFGMTEAELEALLDPRRYTGRCAGQVDAFLAQVEPLLADAAGETPEINV